MSWLNFNRMGLICQIMSQTWPFDKCWISWINIQQSSLFQHRSQFPFFVWTFLSSQSIRSLISLPLHQPVNEHYSCSMSNWPKSRLLSFFTLQSNCQPEVNGWSFCRINLQVCSWMRKLICSSIHWRYCLRIDCSHLDLNR